MKWTPIAAVVLTGLALAACAPRYYDDDYYHDRYRDRYYSDHYYGPPPGRYDSDRYYDDRRYHDDDRDRDDRY
ncbi:MAG TPA: hypothetical protein VHC40_00850 [Rhizomicrobium sp.]|jgi:hypothetical protein|nr:hypothetical protein [Rhizomicrobium sp.]